MNFQDLKNLINTELFEYGPCKYIESEEDKLIIYRNVFSAAFLKVLIEILPKEYNFYTDIIYIQSAKCEKTVLQVYLK